MTIRTLGVACIAVLVSLASADVSAQRRYGGAGLTVFVDPDFRGSSATVRGEIPDLRDYGLNDRVTSFYVDGNQAWEVCQDINFGGRCRVFSGSVSDLRSDGWNDRISSVRPVGFGRGRSTTRDRDNGSVRDNRSNRSYLVFYDQTNYRGVSRDVNGGVNLGSFGDRARSVEVFGGSWELCDTASRNSLCMVVNDNVPDLRRLGFRNGVSSVRVTGNANGNGNGNANRNGWWF